MNPLYLKKLSDEDKKYEIKVLEQLMDRYKDRPKEPKTRIPFELELGDFCCGKLQEEYHKNTVRILFMYDAISKETKPYLEYIVLNRRFGERCMFCGAHVSESIWIKKY